MLSSVQANVKDPTFSPEFVSGFQMVLNGLDNLEARRHVNRLCLAAGVPLVESGTAGYLGQVCLRRWGGGMSRRQHPTGAGVLAHRQPKAPPRLAAQVSVHVKGVTECFECQPKPTPKNYPVCTIRNTPDKPIHCVVWSKDLMFARLFGPPDAMSDLDDAAANLVVAEESKARGDAGTQGLSRLCVGGGQPSLRQQILVRI